MPAWWEEHGAGDQRDPALLVTPPLPENGLVEAALFLAWTDYGVSVDPG
jgi:hypothetical protein